MTAGSDNRRQYATTLFARWRVVGIVALISFSVVVSLSVYTWRTQVYQHRTDFQVRIDTLAADINNRLRYLEVAMEMARGMLTASEQVRREEWRAFTRVGRLFDRVPGMFGFAYVQRVPRSDLEDFISRTRLDGVPDFQVFDTRLYEPAPYDDYCVLKYIEPVERNANAIGLNVASIPASSDAMRRSVEQNRMVVSYHLSLQQTGDTQVGVALYLPFFAIGADTSTPEARAEAVTGWVAVPLAMTDFMSERWAADWSDVELVVRERLPGKGNNINATSVNAGNDVDRVFKTAQQISFLSLKPVGVPEFHNLYISPNLNGDADKVLQADPGHCYVSVISVGDWDWVVTARDSHPKAALVSKPVIQVFLGGSAIATLLVLLTWSLTRTRDHARLLADELTASLRLSEQRYALAVHGSNDGLWDWDLTTGRVYYAPRWKELLGLPHDQVGDRPEEWFCRIASSCLARFHAGLTQHIDGHSERFDIELEMIHADGDSRWMLCRSAAVRDDDGNALRIAGSLSDITDFKHAQDKLRTLAHHDQLTGLANRTLLTERLTHAIVRARRNKEYHYALLFLDFDRFKVINDSMGHGVGDRLLIAVAERIKSQVRDVDTVARFGGDEFVILLEDIKQADGARVFANRLLEHLAKPFEIEACEVTSTVSIGVVDSEYGYDNAEDVIRDADAAMYQAKAGGRAQFCLFDERMHTQAVRRMKLEQDLRNSDFSEQFSVFYQPLVSLDSGEIAGFEALVRWDHPEHGRVGPDEFITIAEETGIIVQLGEWVLNQACDQLAQWRRVCDNADKISINVNISKRQLMHADMTQTIEHCLERTGIPAQMLKLEITESTVMDSPKDIIDAMKRIRELGVRLAMDDFGTGHSSLSCLHQFPIDQLKIDRGFIVNMQEHREFAAVMDAIITLAHFLRLEVVAEGIENSDQLAQLQAMDCKYGQGYFFAKPMPAQAATDYLLGYRDDAISAA